MVIIEGVAFPLDFLNKNDQSVPSSEADNAISSLKKAVIRVCPYIPGASSHWCDDAKDSDSEIGHVVDARLENGKVIACADITDPVTEMKILFPQLIYFGSIEAWVDG